MHALAFSSLQPYSYSSYYYLLLRSTQWESSARGNENGALPHPFQIPDKFTVWP